MLSGGLALADDRTTEVGAAIILAVNFGFRYRQNRRRKISAERLDVLRNGELHNADGNFD